MVNNLQVLKTNFIPYCRIKAYFLAAIYVKNILLSFQELSMLNIQKFATVDVLHDGYVVVDFGPMFLSHALSYPDDVATLLLLQLQERVKHSKVELLHERIDVQLDLVLEELVFERLVSRVGAGAFEALFVVLVVLSHRPDLVVVVSSGKTLQSVWIELSACRVELLPIVFSQLCPERIYGDNKGSSVSLKRKYFAHDLLCFATDLLAEIVERL